MIKEIEFKNHEEWLEIRNQYIGGSDAGAVVGMNPYKSAYTLWAEKTGKIEAFSGNLTTATGAYLEDFVAKLFSEKTGKKVRRKNFTMVNEKYPFACANVDRLVVGEDAFLEIKTTNSLPIMKQLRNSEEFPEAYYCQIVHYLAVTGLKKAYLAVLINCREFKVYELERDEAEIEALMTAEKDFWKYVKENREPVIDGTESSTETLKSLYPESTSENEVDLTAFDTDMETYTNIGKQIKELKGLQDEISNKIKQQLGEAGRGSGQNYRVSWLSSVRNTFNNKKFMSDHKELDFSSYLSETPVRTMRITAIK
ncbi:MAG: YqaJ viral recombinase family protein [Candidatus Fimenecus sp.]